MFGIKSCSLVDVSVEINFGYSELPILLNSRRSVFSRQLAFGFLLSEYESERYFKTK